MIQQALALVGIAAVAAGKQSLFATAEARDLHALLLALLHSGDDGRLRTALSTVLVGVDALGIDNLEADADAHRDWQQRAMRSFRPNGRQCRPATGRRGCSRQIPEFGNPQNSG